MKKVAFVTTPERHCGVNAFGNATAAALKKSSQLHIELLPFAESATAADLLQAVRNIQPDVLLYNYHRIVMPWLTADVIAQVRWEMPGVKQIAQVHDECPPFPMLDALVHSNPTFVETCREYRVRRLLPPAATGSAPAEVVIGSFGYAADHKGFPRVVEQVNREFDRALVRLHIPFNHYGDLEGALARRIADDCRAAAKPGVRIEVSHDYKSPEELVSWLAQHSLNCFFYSEHPEIRVAGVSSAIDYALAARRPIAITDCSYFRHLARLVPDTLIERRTLKQIMDAGIAPFEPLYHDWTAANVVADYERLIDAVTTHGLKLKSNRVLTPGDRELLRPAVDDLTRLCPDIMNRKYPEAVFQNAFIYEQVRHAARKDDRLIVIGGLEDPIGPALIQQGYNVRITDPLVNGMGAREVWEEMMRTGTEYDIVICCSVLEHVAEDEDFVRYLHHILKPGGVAFLTLDYREGWHTGDGKPSLDQRLYTSERLRHLAAQLPEGSLLDPPTWGPQPNYFTFETSQYCFASLAFRKQVAQPSSEMRQEHIYRAYIGRQLAEIDHLRHELARYAPVQTAGPLTLSLFGKTHQAFKRVPLLPRALKRLSRLVKR